jgi:hypothetical protein
MVQKRETECKKRAPVRKSENTKDRKTDNVTTHGKKADKPIKIDRCNEKASTII